MLEWLFNEANATLFRQTLVSLVQVRGCGGGTANEPLPTVTACSRSCTLRR